MWIRTHFRAFDLSVFLKRDAPVLSVFQTVFACEIVMSKKNATRNRIGALWQICTYQHSSSNKTGSADVYQTIGCVFFKSFVVCLKRQTPSSCRKKIKEINLTAIFMALVVCWKTGGRTISLTCALNRLVPPFSLKVIKAAGGTVDTENCEL